MTSAPDEREFEAERENEMRSLLDTAGREIVGTCVQHLQKPIGSTYIGTGKVEELAALVVSSKAEQVVFDAQLSPRQQRNLEKEIECPVLDYNELILDIFARNARTHQAILGVELAQLEYGRSRLRRMWTHLDRQALGGMSGGSGAVRGPGEKQIEIDNRLVRKRILELKHRLEEIEARKDRAVSKRADAFNIALVGYTNAGKSSLMNALTDAGVLAENKLFATLDTRTARLQLDRNTNAVISDTVGFIRNLPPTLITSFHATLAEVREADLLLHVVDSSIATMDEQIKAVENVLETIGAGKISTIMVFNKIDKVYSKTILSAYRRRYDKAVAVSALSGDGIPELRGAIRAFIASRMRHVQVRFSAHNGALDAFLRSRARVIEETYDGEVALLTLEADDRLIDELRTHPDVKVIG